MDTALPSTLPGLPGAPLRGRGGFAPANRATRQAPARGRAASVDARHSDIEADAEALGTKLEAHVLGCLRDAIEWRGNSGIEELWREDQDMYDGEDETIRQWRAMKTGENMPNGRDPQAPPGVTGQQSTIVLNITQTKTDAAVARASQMLVPTNERPWDIAPTPIPDIDDAMKDPLATIPLADGAEAPLALVAEKTKQDAAEKSKAMLTWIEDRFVEGSTYGEIRQVIADAGLKGTGVLKGPFPVVRTKRKWRGSPEGVSVVTLTQETQPTSQAICIENCFPAPDCGADIHDGSYFVERDLMTARDLQKLALLDDYDSEAIARALKEGPQSGHQLVRANGSEDRRRAGAVPYQRLKQFEVFYFYGWVGPDDLLETAPFNRMEPDDPGYLSEEQCLCPYLPAIVTMVNGRAIKATLNPLDAGDFPYDFLCWKSVEGQPWGRGVPRQMRTAQQIVIAAARRLMDNGGLSAGPQVVAMAGAVRPADGNPAITGRKLWWFTPKEGVARVQDAFGIFEIASAQQELSAIIQFGLDMADRLTNMPLLMQGEQQAGTSPETFGGMKLLVQNASSSLRMFAKNADDTLTEPHLRRYNEWGLEHGPDAIRGDHDIKTKGATELVQREEDSEFLLFMWGVRGEPDLRLDPEKIAKALSRTRHFPLESIQYSREEWAQKQAEQAKQPPAPPDPTVQAAQIRADAVKSTEQMRAEDAAKERQDKAALAEADRQSKRELAEVEREIEVMRLSGTEDISIMQIKADLAAKSMENRVASDEMALKLSPANPSGLGI